jgi:hypothetical protein
VENNNFLETEKTFTVTVTKNPDDDGGFHITEGFDFNMIHITLTFFKIRGHEH